MEFTEMQAQEAARSAGIDLEKERFDLKALTAGMNAELEHGTASPDTNITNDDPVMTAKLAAAHLRVSPFYYASGRGLKAWEASLRRGVKVKSSKTEHKTLSFRTEEYDEESGIFSGYAAVYGNIDSGGDIIEPGAFTKTIAEGWERVKILALHNDCWLPIGRPLELREDSNGLFIKAKISDTSMGRDIKVLLKDGVLTELSIGYDPIVFDYDGNLWFATGGFRIYPQRQQQGVLGYIAHSAIEAILNGEQADLSKAVFIYGLALGEGAENGIAASKDGAVILTNQNCYLLRANNGVEAVWCTPYESVGAKVSGENDKTTGGGLAWGGGCSPSLTPDLVMFTDNADPVKLLALDMKTGEIVASMPVLDDLPEGYQVAVENSAIVYDDSEGTVSTIVCNWFGAGSAGLADPDSDSSIQSYANIYDTNWLTKGNCMIAPGVERVDTVKTDSGYEMKSIWSRNDLSDTSILKLSTATGYIYGYVQDLESGMWQYIILDFATGETVLTMDVSNKYGYNNMAIGMYAGNSGNALYCPTGYLELLCLQDRFVYLPEMPYRKVNLDKAARNVLTQEQFEQDGGDGTVASWRNTVTVENVHPNTTVSFRMNNLSGSAAELKLYAYGADGKLAEVGKELWSITDETGASVDTLSDGTLYELRVSVADGGAFDLSEAEKEIKISVVLAK